MKCHLCVIVIESDGSPTCLDSYIPWPSRFRLASGDTETCRPVISPPVISQLKAELKTPPHLR